MTLPRRQPFDEIPDAARLEYTRRGSARVLDAGYPLVLTRHAVRRMVQRGVTVADVVETIGDPPPPNDMQKRTRRRPDGLLVGIRRNRPEEGGVVVVLTVIRAGAPDVPDDWRADAR